MEPQLHEASFVECWERGWPYLLSSLFAGVVSLCSVAGSRLILRLEIKETYWRIACSRSTHCIQASRNKVDADTFLQSLYMEERADVSYLTAGPSELSLMSNDFIIIIGSLLLSQHTGH